MDYTGGPFGNRGEKSEQWTVDSGRWAETKWTADGEGAFFTVHRPLSTVHYYLPQVGQSASLT
jgi:hypothetical protein